MNRLHFVRTLLRTALCFYLAYFYTSLAGQISGSIQVSALDQLSPLQQHPIMLRIVSISKESEVASAQQFTDEQGKFIFRSLQEESDLLYLVESQYDGVKYHAGPFTLAKGQPSVTEANIVAFESNKNLDTLKIERTVLVESVGENMIAISESIQVKNPGPGMLAPSGDDNDHPLEFYFPKGANSMEYETPETPEYFDLSEKKQALILKKAIKPDATFSHRITAKVRYSVHISDRNTPLQFLSTAPIEIFRFSAPKSLKVSSPLAKENQNVWLAQNLVGNQSITMELRGVPIQGYWLTRLALATLILFILVIAFALTKGHRFKSTDELLDAALKALNDPNLDEADRKQLEEFAVGLIRKKEIV